MSIYVLMRFIKLANLLFVSDFALAFSRTVSARAQSPLVNAALCVCFYAGSHLFNSTNTP